MTRKEAIKTLQELWRETNDSWYEEAYNMAIEALKGRPKGEWNDIGGVIRWGCSLCHYAYDQKFNFCPNCGADMRGRSEDDEMR